jgi:hypothetical protein
MDDLFCGNVPVDAAPEDAAELSIAVIDEAIDAVRAELLRRQPIADELDPNAWQEAWDAEPELLAQEAALFRKRADVSAQIAISRSGKRRSTQAKIAA